MGIYKQIESPMPHLTTEHIINRILQHRKLYEARNRRKAEKANITALTALQQQQNTRSIASNQV